MTSFEYHIPSNELSDICTYYGIPFGIVLLINLCISHKHNYNYNQFKLALFIHIHNHKIKHWPVIHLIYCIILYIILLSLFLAPWAILLVWSILLINTSIYLLHGLSILFGTLTLASLYISFGHYWYNNYTLSPTCITLLLFSIIAYTTCTLSLTYVQSGITLYGHSIVLITLNYILVIEVLRHNQSIDSVYERTFNSLCNNYNTQSHVRPVGTQHNNWLNASIQSGGTLSNIVAIDTQNSVIDIYGNTGGIKQSISHTLHTLSDQYQRTGTIYTALIYFLSLCVLMGYGALIQLYNSGYESSEIDNSLQYNQWIGWIIAGCIIFIDLLYAIHSYGRAIHHTVWSKSCILAGYRLILICFDYEYWLIGITCVYTLFGLYLVHQAVHERRNKISQNQSMLHTNPTMCLDEFLIDNQHSISKPTRHSRFIHWFKHYSPLNFNELTSVILNCGFIGTLLIDVFIRTSTFNISGINYQQFELSILCVYLVELVRWTLISYYQLNEDTVTNVKQVIFSVIMAELGYTGFGILLYYRTNQLILLILMVTVPLYCVSLLLSHRQLRSNDYQYLSPPQYRSLPYNGLLSSLLSCGLPVPDYQILGSIVLIILLTIIMTATISLLIQPYTVGVGIGFGLVCAVLFITPTIKYQHTRTHNVIDAVMMATSIILYTVLFVLVQVETELNVASIYILWTIYAAVPFSIALFSACHQFYHLKYTFTRFSKLMLFAAIVVVLCTAGLCMYTINIQTGVYVLVCSTLLLLIGGAAISYLRNNYSMSRGYMYMTYLLFSCGIGFGVYLGDTQTNGYAEYSASFYIAIGALLLLSYTEQHRVLHTNQSHLYYSRTGFAVYYYNLHNNDIHVINKPLLLYILCHTLIQMWCCVTIVLGYTTTGLTLSTASICVLYSHIRQLRVYNKLQYKHMLYRLDQSMLNTVYDTVYNKQLSGYLHDLPADVLHQCETASVYRVLQDTHPIIDRLHTQCGIAGSIWSPHFNLLNHEVDTYTNQLKHTVHIQHKLQQLVHRMNAHLYYELQHTIHTHIKQQQLLFIQYCQYVQTKHNIELKPQLTIHDLQYLSVFELHQLNQWKQQFLAEQQNQQLQAEQMRSDDQRRIQQRIQHADQAHAQRQRLYGTSMNTNIPVAVSVPQPVQPHNHTVRAVYTDTDVLKIANTVNNVRKSVTPVVDDNAIDHVDAAEDDEVAVSAAPALYTTTTNVKHTDAHSTDDVIDIGKAMTVTTDKQYILQLYHNISKYAQQTQTLYTDHQFTGDRSIYIHGERDSSKPSACNQVSVTQWRRASELVQQWSVESHDPSQYKLSSQQSIITDTHNNRFDSTSVVQGNIGTCYLISAITLLAMKSASNTKFHSLSDIFICPDVSQQYSNNGCYVLRFYRQSIEYYVLVDDLIPCVANGEPVFSHTRTINELWVFLIEKAYAKLYSTYESIEAGFIHEALVDLTNGFTYELQLKHPSTGILNNIDYIWKQLLNAYNSGYLIGTSSNTGSDTHVNNGIVLGHAYSVINVYADMKSNQRLIQLANPWGHTEWTGDWCDTSDKWSKYWIKTLNHVVIDDGRFWIAFDDFIQYYQSLYICRLLPHKSTLYNRWCNESASGPTQPYKCPTFTVTVYKPMSIYIVLEQDKYSSQVDDGRPQSYPHIQFYVIFNGGKRVDKIERKIVLGWCNNGLMMGERQISCEVELDKPNQDYTIVCCSKETDINVGFALSIYSAEKIKFKQMSGNIEYKSLPAANNRDVIG